MAVITGVIAGSSYGNCYRGYSREGSSYGNITGVIAGNSHSYYNRGNSREY
jgi:hypothetical protein